MRAVSKYQTSNFVNAPNLTLDISNVAIGSTYHIEQTGQLTTNINWQDVYSFEGSATNTEWSVPATNTAEFFRVVAVPSNPKIGQTATLSTIEQNVSGTAHIVDASPDQHCRPVGHLPPERRLDQAGR